LGDPGTNNDNEQMPERKSAKSAGRKSVETKGKIELSRAGKMAAWTKANGKNDAENPFSKQNHPSK
jgi:hypothetical protein